MHTRMTRYRLAPLPHQRFDVVTLSRLCQHKRSAMRRREDIETVWWNHRCRPGTICRLKGYTLTRRRIDRLNKSGIAYRDMNQAALGIEKRCVRAAQQWPKATGRTIANVALD